MNNSYSGVELLYKRRLISENIKLVIQNFPIIVLTGARQVGKSTLLLNEFKDYNYISLDDYNILSQARVDPQSLISGSDYIIIDEAHKAPELFSSIKLAVDRDRHRRFILSGSSNLLLMKSVSESLAGRAVYFNLMPMTLSELNQNFDGYNNFKELFADKPSIKAVNNTSNPVSLFLRGFMPPIMRLSNMDEVLLWWENYIKTYIERDVLELTKIESLVNFRKVLASLAFRTGNLINQSEIARDTAVSQPTIFRYMSLLETLNLLYKVPPYYKSKSKQTLKSPKIYFIDPALALFLCGYHDEESLLNSREIGGFFENMVYLHLKTFADLLIPKASIYFYRRRDGREVDFIIEYKMRRLALEVKLTKNPSYEDIKNLLVFLEENPDTLRGVFIYTGSEIKKIHSKIIAIPFDFLS